MLIAAGADVNAKDKTKQSAYLISTSEGYLDLLDLTLEHGADVDSLDKYDGTGLIRAAERGHHDIVGRLLQTDIDVDHVNNLGWVALHEAIMLGNGRWAVRRHGPCPGGGRGGSRGGAEARRHQAPSTMRSGAASTRSPPRSTAP